MSVAVMSQHTQTDWVDLADQVGRDIARHSARHDRDETFVAEGFASLKAAGFFKALVPSELGGPGADYRDICMAIRRLANHCGSTALAFSMHCHLVALPVWRWRNEKAPVEALLRRVVNEDLVLISSGGSDWLPGSGVATKVEGGFRIKARKVFASGCPAGSLLMTSAVYDDPEAGPTVLHFGIPFAAAGVKIVDTWHTMGMRGTASHDVEINDVLVADAAISARRPAGKWHPLFHAISMVAFPMVMNAYVGVAEQARTTALGLGRAKKDSGHLATLVGRMENAFSTAELAIERMVSLAESSKPGPVITGQTMAAKTLSARAAIETVECAMNVAGGASFYQATGLERAFRDVQGAKFHPLQELPQLQYAGRLALGWDIDG
jgi:alkylation response protein AidB-like acyl-CoA dehydrogenase